MEQQPPAAEEPRQAARCPELLAPAGDWQCAKAAVENGADAIYFGLDRFNARMRADNFTAADLPRLMDYLHRRGVKGYVTFNTLVFADEMAEAEQYLRTLITAGVDAAIVQDVGVCRLIRQLSPDFPIHASTQMTVTSAAGVEFARELGCSLVVLARECSIQEIGLIASAVELPLEVFVHGALCVAYSGQCLTSEALGGRSANRGECAQACRMPYELISDGQLVPLGDRRYLLSPQDLAGLEVLPELVRAGVASLKIEGRLKSPEYVANITQIYRKALDKTFTGPVEDTRYKLEMAFSRGLHTGWFGGINNQRLVHARFGKKRGVFLGEVQDVRAGSVFLRLQAPLKPGDGIVFDAGQPDQEEEGGRIAKLSPASSRKPETEIRLFGEIDFSRIHAGDKVWKTSDPALDRALRQSFAGTAPHFQRPIDLEVKGRAGAPLILNGRDEAGRVVEVKSDMPLAVAKNQPLTEQRLREQLGRLGGTPICLGRLSNKLEGGVILPMSELNRLRRDLVSQLEELRVRPSRWALREARPKTAFAVGDSVGEPRLAVLVRSMAQLEAALTCELPLIYCEFEDPKKYREAVARFRAAQRQGGAHSEIFVAPPRIFKTGEEWIQKQVRACEPDGWLVRNYDDIRFYAEGRRVGDFSLNVANGLTADYFKNHAGLERLTASYDLNILQLEALLRSAPPAWFEITLHQHIPMFHMEHCVFCAFLSSGTDFTNCGRPCDKLEVRMRDRVGLEHPLKADAGCRNTLFNARAQSGAEYAERLMALGARHFRLEFVNEGGEETARTIAKYKALLKGEITGAQLWRELKLHNRLGVTRGPMES
ncbi:MAG TPA: U32 family peptidase [Verrucomicrobiae bacterium]|nr:U32 family peptidase [Verrucomicrobiae bacterium]